MIDFAQRCITRYPEAAEQLANENDANEVTAWSDHTFTTRGVASLPVRLPELSAF